MPRGSNLHGKPGPGRPPGLQNKVTYRVKSMIEKALQRAGGVAYLARMAEEEPGAFLALIAKIVPRDVNLDVNQKSSISLQIIFSGSKPATDADLQGSEPRQLNPTAGETVN